MYDCVVRTCDKGSHCVLSGRVTDAVVGGVEHRLEPASAPTESGNDDMHSEEGGEEGGSLSDVAVVMLVLVRVLDDDDEVEVEVETFLMSALI